MSSPFRETLTKDWELPSEGLLRLTSSFGKVQILGTEEPQVHLELEKLVWAENETIARSLLDQISFEESQEGDCLSLTVRSPSTVTGPLRFTINLNLRVPRTLRIGIHHSHGDVSIEGIHNSIDAALAHGSANLRYLLGPLRLSHEHGHVEIFEIASAEIEKHHGTLGLRKAKEGIRLHGDHGERRLQEVEGDLIAQTNHGPLFIENPGGAVTVNHEHGPVILRYTYPPSGPIQVRNAFGPVKVELPPLSSVKLNLRVSHGSITGISPTGRLVTGHQIFQSVVLGEGQWPASFEVEHGSVEIRSEGEIYTSTQETQKKANQERKRDQTLREERLIILRLLQEGKISVEEAEALFNALEERSQEGKTSSQEESPWVDWQKQFQNHIAQAIREWEQQTKDWQKHFDEGLRHSAEVLQATERQMKDWQKHFDPGKLISQFFTHFQTGPLINNLSHFAETIGKKVEEWSSELSATERVEALKEEIIPLDPDTLDSLEITLPQGRIEASPGPTSQVKILLRARGKDQGTANQRLWQAQITSTPGPKASLRVESPPDLSRFLFAEVQVSCPESKVLTLRQEKGSIHLREIKGEVIIEQAEGYLVLTDCEVNLETKNASGSVTLMRVEGKGKIVAVNGEIKVKDYEGPLEIEIARGTLKLEDLEATGNDQIRIKSGSAPVKSEEMKVPSLDIETISAPIHLEEIEAKDLTLKTLQGTVMVKDVISEKVKVQSGEGDVCLSFEAPFSGDLQVETLSGKISITLPEDSSATLQMLSGSGRITAPAEITLLEQTPQYLKGVLGTGQGQILLKSATGTITVSVKR